MSEVRGATNELFHGTVPMILKCSFSRGAYCDFAKSVLAGFASVIPWLLMGIAGFLGALTLLMTQPNKF